MQSSGKLGRDQVALLHDMFVASPSFSVLLQGPEHRFALVNPAYQRLIGARNVIGLTIVEALPEVVEQGFVDLLDRVFETGEAFVGADVKVELQRATGGTTETLYLDFVYQPIRDATGAVTAIFVEGTDITTRHHTETALRESQARLQRLNADLERQVIERAHGHARTWKLSPYLLGALNASGHFETANPAWETILGWTEEEVRTMSIFDLVHPDDRDHTRAAFELTRAGQPSFEFVNRYRHKDGSFRWISWVGLPEESYVYCTGRDITAEHAAAAELEAAQAALRQAQKAEAIGQLSGGIAHDFNNLLTGIIGGINIVRERIESGRLEDTPRFLDAALVCAQRAGSLTQRLLAFARRQPLDIRPNDVNRIIANMRDLLTRTLGEKITLQCTLAPALWTAFADANQLENAILNLCINSRDAMPAGGTLRIETSNVHVEEDQSEENFAAGDYIVTRVSDSGSGMSAQVLASAIDPFFTTKAAGRGTGLGLSMVYGFAKQSRGQLRIHSEEGRGTTVELYLPRAHQDAVELHKPTGATPRGHGESILVVEDDDSVRLVLADVLQELGYKVLLAADARPAIPILKSDARIDLMLSDVVLPHVGGRKLAELARSARPQLKILFVTGYAAHATSRAEFLGAGMDMLTKPFALDALASKVRSMLDA